MQRSTRFVVAQESFVSSLADETCHLPVWSGLCLSQNLLALRVQGQFHISPGKLLSFQAKSMEKNQMRNLFKWQNPEL